MLKNVKMRTKLMGGFLLIALIAGVIGYTGIVNIHKVSKSSEDMYQLNTVRLPIYGNLQAVFQRIRVALRDNLAARTPEQHQKFETQIDDLSNEMKNGVQKIDNSSLNPEQKNVYAELGSAMIAYMDIRTRIVNFSKAGKPEQGWDTLWGPEYAEKAGKVETSVEKLEALEVADAKKSMEDNTAMANSAATQMMHFHRDWRGPSDWRRHLGDAYDYWSRGKSCQSTGRFSRWRPDCPAEG